jgi:hypothetical protein
MFRQLCRQGVSPEEARIEIGRILLGVYSLTGTRQMPIEQSQHTIDVCLRRLAAGETESQIFGVESQDPSAASDGGDRSDYHFTQSLARSYTRGLRVVHLNCSAQVTLVLPKRRYHGKVRVGGLALARGVLHDVASLPVHQYIAEGAQGLSIVRACNRRWGWD